MSISGFVSIVRDNETGERHLYVADSDDIPERFTLERRLITQRANPIP
jgi:hypothetical protein